MHPKIFVSHSTKDKEIGKMLKEYLVAMKIPNEDIFISSLPENGVKENIPTEVKEHIKNSLVNIIILSAAYYQSAYCLNEAGIIWFRDGDVKTIVIGLPEIKLSDMVGFIGSDYLLRRLDSSDDVSAIYDDISSALNVDSVKMSVANSECRKLIDKYEVFMQTRVVPSKNDSEVRCDVCNLDEFTTDDEKVLLYYITQTKTRKITKEKVIEWLKENEIYDVNVGNAFDLFSGAHYGHLYYSELNLDVEFFRSITTEKKIEGYINVLKPFIDKHQKLSSESFETFWENGMLTKEDKLFVAYLLDRKITNIYAGWQINYLLDDVYKWCNSKLLSVDLKKTCQKTLNLFVSCDWVFPIAMTSNNNPKEYILHKSLRQLLFSQNFKHTDEIKELIDKYTIKDLPF